MLGWCQAATIYSDNFDGGTVVINDTTPDTTTAGAKWVANENWKADGSIAQVANTSADHSAFLPFTPESGKIYTLTATLSQPTGTTNGAGRAMWAAIGFTNDTLGTADGNNTESFFAGDNAASPLVLWRPDYGSPGNGRAVSFTGMGTTGASNIAVALPNRTSHRTHEALISQFPKSSPVSTRTSGDGSKAI
jgi:hypothetical protein